MKYLQIWFAARSLCQRNFVGLLKSIMERKSRVQVESNTSISTVQFMQNFFSHLQLDLCSVHKCHCSAAHPLISLALEYFFTPSSVFLFSPIFHPFHTLMFARKKVDFECEKSEVSSSSHLKLNFKSQYSEVPNLNLG